MNLMSFFRYIAYAESVNPTLAAKMTYSVFPANWTEEHIPEEVQRFRHFPRRGYHNSSHKVTQAIDKPGLESQKVSIS